MYCFFRISANILYFCIVISFYTENIDFNLPAKREIKSWLKAVAGAEGKQIGAIAVIFCSDEYLLQLNRRYLQHDYYTDIITFDYTVTAQCVALPPQARRVALPPQARRIALPPQAQRIAPLLGGDLFISTDTVRANAERYGQTLNDELHRVILHGLLHLCGYEDATPAQQSVMREREDRYLAMRF